MQSRSDHVPPSFKRLAETYQYAPAVRIGDQILISGIVGVDAEDGFLPIRSQTENSLQRSKPFSARWGRTLDDVAT